MKLSIIDRINWKLANLARFRDTLDVWDWWKRQAVVRKARKELRQRKTQVIQDRGAAEACFYLNHTAKAHVSTRETYALKNKLVRVLYEAGYCVKVTQTEQKLECWHTRAYWDGEDMYCEKCRNTGVYRSIDLFFFVFNIGGQIYQWHQPRELVTWPIELGGEAASYEGREYANIVVDNEKILHCQALVYCWLLERGVKKEDLPRVPGFWRALARDAEWVWRNHLRRYWVKVRYRRPKEDPDWIPF